MWGHPSPDIPNIIQLTSRWAPIVRNMEVKPLTRVIIESPYAGDVNHNLTYARAAALDSVRRGENPFASHLFYTQFLDDTDPEQRKLGIGLGFQMWDLFDKVVFYVDLGMSPGMKDALARAAVEGKPFEVRRLSTASAETVGGQAGLAAVDAAVAQYRGTGERVIPEGSDMTGGPG